MKDKPYFLKKILLHWWTAQGNEQKVMENLITFLNKNALPQNLNLEEVNKLIDYHIYSESREYLEEALLYFQDSLEELAAIKFSLARCYHGLGLLEEAVVSLEEALENQPNNSCYWKLKGNCLLELGDWEAAVSCFNKSLRSAPGDVETIYQIGSIFMFQGEYGEALNCFSGCCKLKPSNSTYWEMKAEMLIKLNQTASASKCFQKAVKYGGRLQLSSRLAYCYAKMGQVKKAKNLFLKVLKNEPDNYEALCNLAGIYHKLDNDDQAYRLLKKAYVLNRNDPLLLNNLGYICFKLGRSRKAIEYYHQALALDPEDRIVLYNLSVSLFQKGNWEDSRAALEKLLDIDSNHADAWTLLGNVNEQLSLHHAAVDCFNKSLGLA